LIKENLDIKVLGDDNISSHSDEIHHLFDSEGTLSMYTRVGLIMKFANQSKRGPENWYKAFEDGKHTFLGCRPRMRYGVLVPTHDSDKLMASLFHTEKKASPDKICQRFIGLLLLAVFNIEDYPYVCDYIRSLEQSWTLSEMADFLRVLLSRDRVELEKFLLGLEDKENNGSSVKEVEEEGEEGGQAWRYSILEFLKQKDSGCCLHDAGF
jgi:hypothetical protein